MKQRGPHPSNKLSPLAVKALKKPGRYSDGNGLYVVVSDTGSKKWILRTVVQGRRTDIGLGGHSTTTLAEAREEAAKLRKIARAGGNPIEDRRKARVTAPTFKFAAEQVHRDHSKSWKNKSMRPSRAPRRLRLALEKSHHDFPRTQFRTCVACLGAKPNVPG